MPTPDNVPTATPSCVTSVPFAPALATTWSGRAFIDVGLRLAISVIIAKLFNCRVVMKVCRDSLSVPNKSMNEAFWACIRRRMACIPVNPSLGMAGATRMDRGAATTAGSEAFTFFTATGVSPTTVE